MIKKEIYPKTIRMPELGTKVHITEKLDGSNLCIFKKNGIIHVAQRSTIYTIEEALAEENRKALYSGLYEFLDKNGIWLTMNLCEGSAICGEWLGMGKIKYDWDKLFGSRFCMFAKARVNDEFTLESICYDHSLFGWIFTANGSDPAIPDFMAVVPVVEDVDWLPNKERLNALYDEYTAKVGRPVEGFVCSYAGSVMKYVRMKNNKVVEYFEKDHKGI